jgi:Zn-dependent M28 family amino/carboxypeptidase
MDYVAWTKRVVEDVAVEGELVFVGYGVVAPEYQWDDYKDVDLRGKVLVMLVNDPPAEGKFGGDAMTYYGRWTYKYEIAAQKGAAAAFIVHETGPAGYPWEVVTGSWAGEQFDLVSEDKNRGRVGVEGWFSIERARSLFERAGLDLAREKEKAGTADFRPTPLGVTLRANVRNELRTVESRNVVARLAGTEAPDESVVYMAHWDHLGTLPGLEGDNIFNGAYDNATGIAGLLELGRAFSSLESKPRRSLLFLAVTAEEQGLLGSRYYAENPLYPPEKTVAAINMDGLNVWGRTRDVTVIGLGQSSLDELARKVAREQGRVLVPDAEPEKGFYYRSDHFEFAKQGVPALYTDEGVDFVDKPAGYSQQKRDEYTNVDYHKESDHIKPDWDLAGAVEDAQLLFQVGYRVSQRRAFPEWKPGTEFKALRDDMLAGRR